MIDADGASSDMQTPMQRIVGVAIQNDNGEDWMGMGTRTGGAMAKERAGPLECRRPAIGSNGAYYGTKESACFQCEVLGASRARCSE